MSLNPISSAMMRTMLGRSVAAGFADAAHSAPAAAGLQKVTAGNHSDILSCQHFLHYFAVHIRQAEMTPLVFVGQPQMIHSQQAQNGGLQIVYVDRVGYYVVAVIVRFPEAEALFHAAAGHPHGEAARMVIASVV